MMQSALTYSSRDFLIVIWSFYWEPYFSLTEGGDELHHAHVPRTTGRWVFQNGGTGSWFRSFSTHCYAYPGLCSVFGFGSGCLIVCCLCPSARFLGQRP